MTHLQTLAPSAADAISTPAPAEAPTQQAFAIRNLSVLAYAQGFTLWHYRASTVAGTRRPDFFGAARDMLSVGDMILVSAAGAGAVLVVASIDDGTPVTVAPLAA